MEKYVQYVTTCHTYVMKETTFHLAIYAYSIHISLTLKNMNINVNVSNNIAHDFLNYVHSSL